MPAMCSATRSRDGRPCETPVVADSCFCFAHNPDLAAKRTEARRQGGRNKARVNRVQRLVPASLKPTISMLFVALEEVHAGTLDPKAAGAMAALAGAIARLYSVGVLEERIAALEAAEERQHA
jgi:TRAP-type mannitol/chloroaromatic compound transport system permease large subunit